MSKEIPLRNKDGRTVAVALVDDEDYDRITRHSWFLNVGGGAQRAAIVRRMARTVYMHREVMGAETNDGTSVRHVNGRKLDNRRANLRVVARTTKRGLPALSGVMRERAEDAS